MNLLIDIGNTRIKSALDDGAQLTPVRSALWRQTDLPALFDSLWGRLDPQRVVVSNVAGSLIEQSLRDWSGKAFGHLPEFVKTAKKSGPLVCAYPDPTQLGIDRWVALQAAITLSPAGVVVIDCGTATTVDLVTADRVHRGGAILPGIHTMRRALAGGTANLDVDGGNTIAFANNTRDGIAGGTAYALAGAIDRLVNEGLQIFDEAFFNVLTGGEAEQVRPLLKTQTTLEPDLVLLGLAEITKRN
ncbi:MAG: type III pantothenate kinase [Gammaproteobacteria bacterium]|nr:type III pantothenate kinase [Gammaproteobacteria bacterium]